MSYHHPTPFERGRLETLYKQGYSIRAIAKELSRNPSTISRELRRFKDSFYEAEAAHQQYMDARKQVDLKGKFCVKTIYRWLYAGILKVGFVVLRHKGKRRKSVET